MSSIALYYPWMHFQDDNWLKLALLTWDRVVRVRTRDLEDHDRALVRRIRAETDFLIEITPSSTDLAQVTEAFKEVIDTDQEQIRVLYGRGRCGGGGVDYRGQPMGNIVYAPSFPIPPRPFRRQLMGKSGLYWLYHGPHGSRMSDGMWALLREADLAIAHNDVWTGVRPRLGLVYAAALTDVIARNNLLSPVTDDPQAHRAVGALDRLTELLFVEDGHAPALENADSAYLHVALNAVVEPKRLSQVPVAKLIKFRHQHSAELVAFRQHIKDLSVELEQIAAAENVDVAHAHLKALYTRTTEPQLRELQRALRGLGVESTAGALGLKLDLNAAAGTVLGSLAAAQGQLAVAGTAVAITVVPYLAGKIKARRQLANTSPVAYLLAANRKLAGASLLSSLERPAPSTGRIDL